MIELATMEARCHSGHSLDYLRYCFDPESIAGSKYCDTLDPLRERLHANGPPDRISPMRSRRGRLHLRRLGQDLGKAASILAWHCFDYHQQCLGRCCRDELRKPVVGTRNPRGWLSTVRGLGECERRRPLLRSRQYSMHRFVR